MNFSDLGLSKDTVKAIEEVGVKNPTTVQADVIPSVLEGRDIFTIAPQRSGKTYSYVLPLIDMIAKKTVSNVLIVTPDSAQASNVSDCFAVFNKYHPLDDDDDANVIIATPDLILELDAEQKLDLSHIDVLVVDDINLIKKKRQLGNLEKILEKLPSEKQNIVFTNRRSKETQNILDKILQTPAQIKVDKDKEDEADHAQESIPHVSSPKPCFVEPKLDAEALEYVEKFHIFGDKTPRFLLIKGQLKRY
ncbi:MAG: DEAD/DEAH box helicase [Alphaproteobacteria bacterium]|nr:DEAD/DEAH box helicase [Alphaproteobacteria bacterium]